MSVDRASVCFSLILGWEIEKRLNESGHHSNCSCSCSCRPEIKCVTSHGTTVEGYSAKTFDLKYILINRSVKL